MNFTKLIGLAAIGLSSACGAASAATVDVFYKFSSIYNVNCEDDCENERRGDFEVRLSYENAEFERIDSRDSSNGFLYSVVLSYSGDTTAEFITPIGDVTFQAIGRGNQEFDFGPGGGLSFTPDERLSPILEPNSNRFYLEGATSFGGRNLISFGQNGIYSLKQGSEDFGGTDLDAGLRIENGRGAFITTVDFSATITEATFTISDDPLPSPVPLPASAPLLLAGLGLLGFRARRRR